MIPLKSPERCKTRLAGALSATARQRLAREMFEHVLESVRAAELAQVVVVTPAALRVPRGVVVVHDTETGLNAALETARAFATERGAERLAIVAADLPHVRTEDVDALVRAGSRAVAIAPDRGGDGTNALCLDVRARFDFAFGPGSARRHALQTARAGHTLALVRRAGLAFDVDTPDDHALWRGSAEFAPGALAGAAGTA